MLCCVQVPSVNGGTHSIDSVYYNEVKLVFTSGRMISSRSGCLKTSRASCEELEII